VDALIEDSDGDRWTEKALEQAPVGGEGGEADWTANEKTALRAILGIPITGSSPETPTTGVLAAILDDTGLLTDGIIEGEVAFDEDNDYLHFKTNLTAAFENFYRGRLCVFTSGLQIGNAGIVTAYNGTTKVLTVEGGMGNGSGAAEETTFALLPAGINPLTVRKALGMAEADLDTQLDGLSTFDASSDGVTLAPDGLDAITNTEPDGLPDNFREKLLWLYRRFFKKATRTATTITHYADNGTTPLLEQTISDTGGVETQGAAEEP
jgi:hypothetical protein